MPGPGGCGPKTGGCEWLMWNWREKKESHYTPEKVKSLLSAFRSWVLRFFSIWTSGKRSSGASISVWNSLVLRPPVHSPPWYSRAHAESAHSVPASWCQGVKLVHDSCWSRVIELEPHQRWQSTRELENCRLVQAFFIFSVFHC